MCSQFLQLWLGIGEISPEADLHVSGGQQVVAVFENNTASASIAVAGTSTSAVITASDTNTAITNTAAGDMHFLTNNAYVMTLENGGNVGVGTTDPGQLLDVVGDNAGGAVSVRVQNEDNISVATIPSGSNVSLFILELVTILSFILLPIHFHYKS